MSQQDLVIIASKVANCVDVLDKSASRSDVAAMLVRWSHVATESAKHVVVAAESPIAEDLTAESAGQQTWRLSHQTG